MTIYRMISGAARASILAMAMTVAAFATSANAQQPSAAAMAVAREIVELKHTAELFKPVITGIIERNKLTFLQTNPNLQRDLDAVASNLRAEYAVRQKEIDENIARLYALHFSEGELKETLTFYKSPLGKKLTEEEPKFVDESMRFVDDWSEKLSLEVLNKFRVEMKKKGHDI